MKTRLKYWRRKRGLTQDELCTLAGTSKQTVVNIERYGKEPIINTVKKLSRALNISTEEFFTDDPSQFDGSSDEEDVKKPAA
jgi:DNA-binding XRE family transcriptional regulator